MTQTHTPGPWHRNIKPATKYTTIWSGRNKHVAYVATSGLTPEEAEANIALIAAAPEMLAALRWAAEVLDGYGTTKVGRHWDAIEKARAAIAKAEGRS